MVNVSGRIQKLNAACIPPADARDDWEIITDLILSITGETPDQAPRSIDQLSQIISTSIPDFEGKTLTSLNDLGEIITETGITIPLVQRENQRKAHGEIVG